MFLEMNRPLSVGRERFLIFITGKRKFVINLLLPFRRESDKIAIPESAARQRGGCAYL